MNARAKKILLAHHRFVVSVLVHSFCPSAYNEQ
jgi:hypothetical protein